MKYMHKAGAAVQNDPSGVYPQRKGRIARYLRQVDAQRGAGTSIHNDIYRPQCWELHTGHKVGDLIGDNSTVPLDWPHTVHALYSVRCNLFHGAKSRYSEGDAKLVLYSFQVLVNFLALGGYLAGRRHYAAGLQQVATV